MTNQFIHEEISILFSSEKFGGWWWWWVETSNYSYKLQVQVSYQRFEINLGPGPELDNIDSGDGLVMTVKTHGHTVGPGMDIPRDNGQVNFNDMAEVNHTAILIIRNPFKALIGRFACCTKF